MAYLGTPEVGVPPLRALVADGHDVLLVVSRPDKRRGRGGALLPSPVKAAALELGLPVTDKVDDVVDAGADLAVVVAFGRLIKKPVLDAVPMINMHFSLLPRWRGAAPVERAILAGDLTTGVGIMRLEENLDTGPIYAEHVVQVLPHETAAELRARLTALGTNLLLQLLRRQLLRIGGLALLGPGLRQTPPIRGIAQELQQQVRAQLGETRAQVCGRLVGEDLHDVLRVDGAGV